jgi:hypothetical protein
MKAVAIAVAAAATLATSAMAEEATYGAVDLTGLARNSWGLNPPGESNTMVCNVNGPDGFLTIRTAPSSNSGSARELKRLAIVVVDTSERQGNWIRVLSAHRTHTVDGKPQAFKALPVAGWAHDNYLCDFLD